MVLHAPPIKNRFWEFELVDPWTNNFYNITSAHLKMGAGDFDVTRGGDWAVVGPGFKGKLPRGVKRVNAPYDRVWVVGRTYLRGPNDLGNLHRIQDQYSITPLSKFGTRHKAPPAQEERHPVDQRDDSRHPAGRGSPRVLHRAGQGDAEVPGRRPPIGRCSPSSRPSGSARASARRTRTSAPTCSAALATRSPRGRTRFWPRALARYAAGRGQAQRLSRDGPRRVGHELHRPRDRRPARDRWPAGEHRDLPGRPVRQHEGAAHRIEAGTSCTSPRAACPSQSRRSGR